MFHGQINVENPSGSVSLLEHYIAYQRVKRSGRHKTKLYVQFFLIQCLSCLFESGTFKKLVFQRTNV